MNQDLPILLPIGLLGGCILGGAYLFAARHTGRREILVLGAGLVTAALVYLAFSMLGGGDPASLRKELQTLAVFTVLTLIGVRFWTPLVGIGWLLHAGVDVIQHWPPQPWVPAFYPLTCGAFDLVVAAYFLFLATMRGEGDAPA